MNLVKKLFKRGDGRSHGTALAKRRHEGGGPLGRKHGFGFDEFWQDVGRDPWSLARDPWAAFERMGERLDGLARWPAMDVSEDDAAVTIRCDVPGLDAKDLDVQVRGNLLTISGSREDERDDRKRGWRRHERVSGSFSRTVTLPAHVDARKIDARHEKGTLTITLPKVPGKGPRRVTVKAA